MMRSRAAALACLIPGCSSSAKKRHPSGDSLSYYEAHQGDDDEDRHRQFLNAATNTAPPPPPPTTTTPETAPSHHQRSSSASTSPEPGLLASDSSSSEGGETQRSSKSIPYLLRGGQESSSPFVHVKISSAEPTPPNSPVTNGMSFATTTTSRSAPVRSSSSSSSRDFYNNTSSLSSSSGRHHHLKPHPITPPPLPSKSTMSSGSSKSLSAARLKRSSDALFGSPSIGGGDFHQLVPYVDPCCRPSRVGHTRSHSANALIPVLMPDESSSKYVSPLPAPRSSKPSHRRTKSQCSENSYLSSSSDDDHHEERIPSPVQSVKSMSRCASPTPNSRSRPVTPTSAGHYYPHPRNSSYQRPSSPMPYRSGACPTPPLSPRPYSSTSLVPFESPSSPMNRGSSALVLHRSSLNSSNSILSLPPSRSSSPARLRAREIVAHRQHQKQMAALQHSGNTNVSADDRSCVSNLSWSSGNTSFSRLGSKSQLHRQHQLEQEWMTLQQRQGGDALNDDDGDIDQDSLEDQPSQIVVDDGQRRPRQVVLETVTLLRSIKHQIKAMKRRERNLCQHLAVQRGERMVVQERIETLEARRLRVEARFLRPLPLVVLVPVAVEPPPTALAEKPEPKRKPRRLLSWTRRRGKRKTQAAQVPAPVTPPPPPQVDVPQEYQVCLVSEGLEWKVGDPVDKIRLLLPPQVASTATNKGKRALLIHFGPTATQPMAAAVSWFDPCKVDERQSGGDHLSDCESSTEGVPNKDSFDEDESSRGARGADLQQHASKDLEVSSTKSTLSSTSSRSRDLAKPLSNKKETYKDRLAAYLQRTVPLQDKAFWERLYMTSAGVLTQQDTSAQPLPEASRQAIVNTLQKHAGVWNHDLNQVVDKQTRQVHWVCHNEAQLGIHQYKYYDPVPPPT